MSNQVERTVTTYVVYVDQYDRLIERLPAAPNRRHHIDYPHQVPVEAVVFRYYDVTTEVIGGATYHNECKHSDWTKIERPELIGAN